MSYFELAGFKLTKKLGEGGFAKVYLGHNLQNEDQKVAVKIMKNDDVGLLESEVKPMMGFDDIGLVRMLDYGANAKMSKVPGGKFQHVNYVIMELAQNGELFDIIAPIGGFSERITRFYFKQFLESLAYLHNQGVCHRDLKPENLLLGENWRLKIADFGFSV